MQKIKQIIESRQKECLKKIAHNEMILDLIKKKQEDFNSATSNLSLSKQASDFLEKIANNRRNNIKQKFENVISEALRLIYGNEYSAEISYSMKNNRTFCEIRVIKKTSSGTTTRTMEGFGGGVSDTVSVALRLLVLINTNKTAPILFLDESYKHMDTERIEQVAEFLKKISKQLNIQIIMCSHHEVMREFADTIHEIKSVDGKAVVKKITRR